MWNLSRDHVVGMVERVMCGKVFRNNINPILTMGEVAGKVYSEGSLLDEGDVVTLSQLTITEEVAFRFKRFMTIDWFILTGTPLNRDEGLLSSGEVAGPENTILEISNFMSSRVMMVLQQGSQPPLLITVTKADATGDETFDDRLWIISSDGKRRDFSPNKFVARLLQAKAQV